MKCKQIQIRLADYSAQRLAPSEAGDIRRHLESCNACSLFLNEEAALAGGLERLSAVEPRTELWSRVAVALDAPEVPARHGWRFSPAWPVWGRKPLAAFATGMVAAVGLVAFTRFDAAPPESAPVVQRPVAVSSSPLLNPVMNPDVNPEVDDPMGEQMNNLMAAVDQMTQE